MSLIRRLGIARMPVSRKLLHWVGVFPIRDHYYEPLFRTDCLRKPLDEDRDLPGVDMNIEAQLKLLGRFDFADELAAFPVEKTSKLGFHYHNNAFESGDAEYLYSIIRLLKPRRIVEIGAGASTLMARNAITKNKDEDPDYRCEHLCIEPYERDWLEKIGVELIRKPVEEVDRAAFVQLHENDILFIDSSHVIRPQGDVLVECLEILPSLGKGVLVHVHDIFTPRDYPKEWLADEVRFWNEQYLLEAFLSFSHRFEIIGALNYLTHHHADELAAKFPIFAAERAWREAASFWIRKVK
ncbi:MAG: class I SAM-dependent methyltransferase [Planctomycetes bacterium]|nr:class I SAM-dependent methyltransferase [Planctomycetota bacterium]